MKKLVLITAASIVLGAPLALADSAPRNASAPTSYTEIRVAPSDPMGRCAMLDARYQRASATHQAGSYAHEAVALHTEGETLCSSHQAAAGVKYLASALKIMRAEPRL